MAISLAMLLAARDHRRDMQLMLLHKYPGSSVVVLTVNIPGAEKRTSRSVAVGREGMKVLSTRFPVEPLFTTERDLPTGYEGYFVTTVPPEQAKRVCVEIEETHPLGRIFDIDVIGEDGIPLSRTDYGGSPRKCLICGNDARVCMRLRSHSTEELLNVINKIHDDYFLGT